MIPDELLKAADQVLFERNGNGLTDIQHFILRESLAGKGYEDMQGYDNQHIKNEGSRLWRLLSNAIGEKVSKTSFRSVLEKRLRIGSITSQPPIPLICDLQTWVGRESLTKNLLMKLNEGTRLLWLTGISGIGKTTLAEYLAVRAWSSEQPFQWICTEILDGQGSDFTAGAANLLIEMGEKEINPQDRNDPKRLNDLLIRKLQSNSYWIQIDSLERLFNPSNPTGFADSSWQNFFQQCLMTSEFRSRLVLTAQALPRTMMLLRDRKFWSWQVLQGLSMSECLNLFAKHGIFDSFDSENQSILSRIGQTYEGHPLVLQVIAGEVINDFNGNITQYWERYEDEFSQVARKLESKRVNPFVYNQELKEQVRDRVEVSLKRLSIDAFDLLCRSAVYRRAVPQIFWQTMLWDRSSSEQQDAYSMLRSRVLVEREGTTKGQDIIRQHNLIRDIAYDLLRQNLTNWRTAERRASETWLNNYETVVNAPNLEKVRAYLEAFYHLSEIEAWSEADGILHIRPSEVSEELGVQLGTWGYYREQIEMYSKLCHKLAPSQNSICLKNLGVAYRFLDNYAKASAFYDQALNLFLELGQREEGAWIVHEMGLIKADQGKDDEAREYYERALQVFTDLDVHKGIALALNDIARVEVNQRNHAKAIERYKKSLNIYPSSEDQTGRAWILYNLGQALAGQEEYTEAQNYINRSLHLFRELENKTGIVWSLHGLGSVTLNLGNEESAYNYTREALTLFRELQNQTGIAWTLHILGRIEFRRSNFTSVGKCYREKLLIWKELDNLSGIAFAIKGFARFLTTQQQPNKQLLPPYLFGVAEAILEAIKYPLPAPDRVEYDQGVNEAKKQMDEAEFLTSWSLGKVASIDQVISEILSIESED